MWIPQSHRGVIQNIGKERNADYSELVEISRGVIAALKIQVSQETKSLLDEIGGFVTELRGQIHVKVGRSIT